MRSRISRIAFSDEYRNVCSYGPTASDRSKFRRPPPLDWRALNDRWYNPNAMKLMLEVEREEDGRWLAEVPDLPGVLAYGSSRQQAIANAEALAFRVLAERLENGEPIPQIPMMFAVAS